MRDTSYVESELTLKDDSRIILLDEDDLDLPYTEEFSGADSFDMSTLREGGRSIGNELESSEKQLNRISSSHSYSKIEATDILPAKLSLGQSVEKEQQSINRVSEG